MKMPNCSDQGDYQPCPAGSHAAIASRLIDLGTQETHFQGKVKHQRKVYIEFAIPAERTEDDRPMSVGNRYTFSSSPKSTLRQHLEAWRGKRFGDDEIAGFDLASILGKPCLLNVTHSTREDRTYADIASISPLPKGMPAPSLAEPTTYLSLDAAEFDRGTFESLTDRLREIIAASPEYRQLQSPPGQQQIVPPTVPPTAPPATPGAALADAEDDFAF